MVNPEDAEMDINQAARMIEWLDEERRRDKATIATLEERLAQQQDTVTMLSKRINSMESDQTVIRTQISPSGRETDHGFDDFDECRSCWSRPNWGDGSHRPVGATETPFVQRG